MEVAIGVKVGEGEGVVIREGGVVIREGGVRRKDESLLFVFHHFCLYGYFCLMLYSFIIAVFLNFEF